MKLVAILLFFAIVGKLSAAPYPYRIGYYRAVDVQPQQQLEEVEADEEDDQDDEPEAEISEEDFSNDKFVQDDDDSDEHEEPPNFSKLFPLPQRNSPAHNFPLAVMMGDIQTQAWGVRKGPPTEVKKSRGRLALVGRNEIELARDDDDDDDDDSDEDEEEEEDDLPDWDAMFPTQDSIDSQGPPEGVVDTSSIPSFRSSHGGSRIVYVPARQLRQYNNRQVIRPQISGSAFSRQYVMRHPNPPRSPVVYTVQTSNQRRPQQLVLASSVRRPQSQVYYMPVRRNSYNPYTSRYVPRYRYYK